GGVGVRVAVTVPSAGSSAETSGADPVATTASPVPGTTSAAEVTEPTSTTVPIAWASAAGISPTPVGLNAVTATTVSAPAARPVRWRSTVRDLLRLTRSAFRRAGTIVPPN